MKDIIKIRDRVIGGRNPTYIIAEMSANHSGGYENAIKIINSAKKAGADCIKIQTYTADTLTIDSSKEYFQIKKGTWEGQNLHRLYEKAYTPWEWQEGLKKEAEKVGLDFLSTPFDKTAVDFLERLGIDFYKIASFELVDIPLIKYIASKGKPLILSTGMGSLGEIEEAVNAIKSQNNENLCLLKCSSAYPAIAKELNLKTIPHLKETFNVPVGFSDHSLGSISTIVAVSLGANVIEKHICLNRNIPTPDSSFSMEPAEFKQMVDDIRLAEQCIGNISYNVTPGEVSNLIFRKSIFIIKNINEGEPFTTENIKIIRPGQGLAPKYYGEIIGKVATRNLDRGTPLEWNMIR